MYESFFLFPFALFPHFSLRFSFMPSFYSEFQMKFRMYEWANPNFWKKEHVKQLHSNKEQSNNEQEEIISGTNLL